MGSDKNCPSLSLLLEVTWLVTRGLIVPLKSSTGRGSHSCRNAGRVEEETGETRSDTPTRDETRGPAYTDKRQNDSGTVGWLTDSQSKVAFIFLTTFYLFSCHEIYRVNNTGLDFFFTTVDSRHNVITFYIS